MKLSNSNLETILYNVLKKYMILTKHLLILNTEITYNSCLHFVKVHKEVTSSDMASERIPE